MDADRAPAGSEPQPLRGGRLLFLLAPLLLLAGADGPTAPLFTVGLAALDLGGTAEGDRSAAACLECHSAVHGEWSQSRHSVAWTNGIFQREYQSRPLSWCVHCHAPLADEGALQVEGVAAEGVNCAVCHLRDGQVLAAARAESSPHDTRVVEGFGDASFCAGCHQFNFPLIEADGSVVRYTDHPMQSTVSEYREGPYSGRPGDCLACHGRSPARHRFPGAHSLGALQHAAELRLCQAGRGRLRLTVRNTGAGHDLPTGDLHRHLVLRAWRPSAPTALWETVIGRSFEPAPGGGKQVRTKTSIPPKEERSYDVATRTLGGEAGEPVRVELRYVYTADELPSERNDPGEPTSVVVIERTIAGLGELEKCP
jgi:Cytochrome c554 and c-prime